MRARTSPRRHRLPRLARVALALLVAGVALLLGAGPASAHATLISSNPVGGQVLPSAPAEVRIDFSEAVDPTSESLEVIGPDGRGLTLRGGTRRLTGSQSVVVATLPGKLAAGTYEVRWHLVARDGHPSVGSYRFAVRAPSAPLVSTGGGSGPSVASAVGRGLAAGGALALVGLAFFPALVLRPAGRRMPPTAGALLVADAWRRLRRPVQAAAAAAFVGTLLVLSDTTAAGAGRGLADQLLHPIRLVDSASVTRTGQLMLLRLLAVLVIVLLLAAPARLRLRLRPRAAGPSAVVAVLVLVLTFALSSHAAAAADRAVAVPLDAMHLLAAGIWAGGLIGLALAGLPAARALHGREGDLASDAAGAVAGRFSVLAQAAMVGLLATGSYAVLLRVTALRDLGDSAWGGELVVKLALWVSVLLVAAGNATKLVPMLADRARARAERRAAAGELASSVRVELALAAALVGVAAVLAATAPPEQAAPIVAVATDAPAVTTAQGTGGGYRVNVQAVRTGKGAGVATVFGITLTAEGETASAQGASALLTGPDGVGRTMGLDLVDAGQWSSARLAVPAGPYKMTVQFDRTSGSVRVPVSIRVG